MHVGKSYGALEFLAWSRRKAFVLLLVSLVPVLVHTLLRLDVGIIPWSVILLLGTTVALVAGFKNTSIYNRSVEAQQIWSAISTSSRLWGGLSCELASPCNPKGLIYRHLAWLTALRFALRSPRPWETAGQKANAEYRKRYRVLEQETTLSAELAKYLPAEKVDAVLKAANPAARLLYLQSEALKALLDAGTLSGQSYGELLRTVRDLHDQQARCERIKNNPYPRQYAVVSALFVSIFCILLPFGLIGPFEELGAQRDSLLKGYTVWLVVPVSVLIGWMYTALDQVGEATANPFEGNANDVPISQISRSIEIELRELLGESGLPPALEPVNGIAT
jgi:ion channel-forming bestrophin family protein